MKVVFNKATATFISFPDPDLVIRLFSKSEGGRGERI